jgi:hypothetical protein
VTGVPNVPDCVCALLAEQVSGELVDRERELTLTVTWAMSAGVSDVLRTVDGCVGRCAWQVLGGCRDDPEVTVC